MQDILEVQGIVLSSMPIGETDRRVLLLTREFGKISCFARGARKQNSVFLSQTRPFAFGTFSLYPGKNSYTLTKCEIKDYFEPIVMNPTNSAYGCYFLELTSMFTHENLNAENELILLYMALKALEKDKMKKELIMISFEMKMLQVNGLLPSFSQCAQCGQTLQAGIFVPSEMKCHCEKCLEKSAGLQLSQSALYTFQFIGATSPQKLFSFDLTKEVLKEVRDVSESILKRVLPKPPTSKEMIQVLLG